MKSSNDEQGGLRGWVSLLKVGFVANTRIAEMKGLKLMLVMGPALPEEVEEADLLTAEDHRDLTLDHIERTCRYVFQLEIVKRG